MQRNKSTDGTHENMETEGDYCKTQPDIDWLLPLLWNHRQHRKNNSISISRNEKFILLSKPEEPKEKLQLGRISEYDR
ncbi:hypothetical protein JCM35486_24490 [Blautia wexlerae]